MQKLETMRRCAANAMNFGLLRKNVFFAAVLALVFSLSNFVQPSHSEAGLSDGLVSHYKLDNTAADAQNANPGTVNGGAVFSPSAAPTVQLNANSLTLDGVDDTVTANSSAGLNGYPLTVAAWIKTTQNGTSEAGIVNKYVSGSYNGYQLFLAAGRIRAWYFKDRANNVYGGGQGLDGGLVNDGKWHHVAFTVDSTGGKIYVDGTLRTSRAWAGTAGATTTTQNLAIGKYTGFLKASVDDVRIYNRSLASWEVQALGAKCLGHYKLDKDAADAQGVFNGTVAGGAVFVPTGAPTVPNEGALMLDGTDDFVSIPSNSELNTYPFTAATWIKTTDTTGQKGIVNKYVPSSYNGYQIFTNNGTLHAWYFRDRLNSVWGGGSGLNGGAVNDGKWHHVAFTVDASGGKLYVDGVLKDQKAWAGLPGATSTTQPVSIGRYGTGFFKGGVDEVRVYNDALSAAEVTDLASADNNPGDATAPAVPAGVAAAAGDAKVDLTWTANTEADLAGYNVYRGTVQAGPFTKVNTTTVSSNSFSNTGLTNGTTYWFRVSAVDDSGNESAQSAAISGKPAATGDTTPPAVPGGFGATAGDAKVDLKWNANTETDLAGYNVYRGAAQTGPFTKLNAGTLTAVTFTDTAVTNGNTYWYAASSLDQTGNESAKTAAVSAKPGTTTPPPTGVIAEWALDTNANDTLGALNGTVNGGATFNANAAPTLAANPGAIVLDGVNDSVTVGNTAALNAYPFTVAAWVNTTQSTGNAGIVNKYVSKSYNGYQIFVSNGSLGAWYFRDSANNVYGGGNGLAGGPVNDGQWHHVAFTVDSAGGKLYVDGVLKDSKPWTGTAGSTTTTQGLRIGQYDHFLKGSVDEACTFNKALSASEVAALAARAPDSTAPKVPAGLAAFPGNLKVDLKWTANTESDLAGYNVYKADLATGPFVKQNGATPVTGTSSSVSGLVNGTSYWFKLSAVDKSGNESAQSAPVTAIPVTLPAPTAPLGVNAVAGNGQVNVTWNANPATEAVSSYDIYRSGTQSGTYVKVGSATTTSYTNTGLTNGTTYWYQVAAVNSTGESPKSTAVSATPTGSGGTGGGTIPLKFAATFPTAMPVSTGIPFPRGAMPNLNNILVQNGSGQEVPAQFSGLAKWPDGSWKSVLVTLIADPAQTYNLKHGSGVTRQAYNTGMTVVDQTADIVVTTGQMKFRLDKTKFTVLDQVWRDMNGNGSYEDTETLMSGPGDIFLVNAFDGVEFLSSRFTNPVYKVEESGPVRTRIRVSGQLQSSSGAKLTDFIVWLYAYAGTDLLKMEYSLVDSRQENDVNAGRSNLALAVKGYGLRLPFKMTGATYQYGGESGAVYSGSVSGNSFLYQTGAMNYVNGTLQPFSFSYSGAGTGAKAPGWMDIKSANGGISAMVRDFWQQFPKELAIESDKLVVYLHPTRAGSDTKYPTLTSDGRYKRPNTFYFPREGGAKTYQMLFRFHRGNSTSLPAATLNDAFQANPRLTAPADWYANSGVFGKLLPAGPWSVGYDKYLVDGIYKPAIESKKSTGSLTFPYGWRDYGDRMRLGWLDVINGVEIPGFYNDTHVGAHNFMIQYLRTLDNRWWELGEIATRHWMDIDVSHSNRIGYWKRGYGPGEGHLIKHEVADHSSRNLHRGHAHISGLPDYYLLTGDPRAWDVMNEVGSWHANAAADFYPTPLPSPLYMEAERDAAWPLYVMVEAYRGTGDIKYMNAAKQAVNHLLLWYQRRTDHLQNGNSLGKNDYTQGTGWWAMYPQCDNCSAGWNGTNPWMAGHLLSAVVKFYEWNKELNLIPNAPVKEMLLQTMNYIHKWGWETGSKYYVYSEQQRSTNGGKNTLLPNLAYLGKMVSEGGLANPSWYSTSSQWLPIAKGTYDGYHNLNSGGETQSWGFYGYEMIYPADYWHIMHELYEN